MGTEKLTLKEAREKGKLKQFIREREKDTPPADGERFERLLNEVTKGKPKTEKTSRKPKKKARHGD